MTHIAIMAVQILGDIQEMLEPCQVVIRWGAAFQQLEKCGAVEPLRPRLSSRSRISLRAARPRRASQILLGCGESVSPIAPISTGSFPAARCRDCWGESIKICGVTWPALRKA